MQFKNHKDVLKDFKNIMEYYEISLDAIKLKTREQIISFLNEKCSFLMCDAQYDKIIISFEYSHYDDNSFSGKHYEIRSFLGIEENTLLCDIDDIFIEIADKSMLFFDQELIIITQNSVVVEPLGTSLSY